MIGAQGILIVEYKRKRVKKKAMTRKVIRIIPDLATRKHWASLHLWILQGSF